MSEAIRSYLDKAGVDYKIHVPGGPTPTAQDAAFQLNVPLETIIKSILFTNGNNQPILAILTGDKRVDRKKLAAVLGASKIKIASPEATKAFTGFEVGTMPPLGHKKAIPTAIDHTVVRLSRVYGGSGTLEALIEIDPQDIARLTNARVADICE